MESPYIAIAFLKVSTYTSTHENKSTAVSLYSLHDHNENIHSTCMRWGFLLIKGPKKTTELCLSEFSLVGAGSWVVV